MIKIEQEKNEMKEKLKLLNDGQMTNKILFNNKEKENNELKLEIERLKKQIQESPEEKKTIPETVKEESNHKYKDLIKNIVENKIEEVFLTEKSLNDMEISDIFKAMINNKSVKVMDFSKNNKIEIVDKNCLNNLLNMLQENKTLTEY
jgi:hypothetical protein